MLYYYAHTGHKVGLERLRRGMALKGALAAEGIEMQMLVNDFRAGVAMKDEQGLREYITIETIQDIDAVAQKGDSVIIDSNEDEHGRLVKFVADFTHVWRFAHDANDRSIHAETLFVEGCDSQSCLEATIVDASYFEAPKQKQERTLFFLRDYDDNKTILSNSAFFDGLPMELLLGHYFYVKYEDALSQHFSQLHEAETYQEMLCSSSHLVTASAQAALEAKAAGANVVFLDLGKESLYATSQLEQYGICVVKGFDIEAVKEAIAKPAPTSSTPIPKLDLEPLLTKLK